MSSMDLVSYAKDKILYNARGKYPEVSIINTCICSYFNKVKAHSIRYYESKDAEDVEFFGFKFTSWHRVNCFIIFRNEEVFVSKTEIPTDESTLLGDFIEEWEETINLINKILQDGTVK